MRKLLLLLGLVFMATTVVMAQRAPAGMGPRGEGIDPEMRAKMMKEHTYNQLGVTEEQKAKLEAIEQESKKEMADIKMNSKKVMAELENLIETGASDDKLIEKVDELQKVRDAAIEALKSRIAKSRAVLDAKQQAKGALMLGKMMDMGGMGMGMWNQGGMDKEKATKKKAAAKKKAATK